MTIVTNAAWMTPVVTGLVQVIKTAVASDITRWVPLISVVLGAGLGALIIGTSVAGVLAGVIVGLGAVGLFEFGKTTIAGK